MPGWWSAMCRAVYSSTAACVVIFGAPGANTLTMPVISQWKRQTYSYVPGVENATGNGGASPLLGAEVSYVVPSPRPLAGAGGRTAEVRIGKTRDRAARARGK